MGGRTGKLRNQARRKGVTAPKTEEVGTPVPTPAPAAAEPEEKKKKTFKKLFKL